MAHPMYEITDNALFSVDNYTEKQIMMLITDFVVQSFLLVVHHECSQVQQNL